MLHDYLIWWAEQMRSLVPERFAARTRYANALVLQGTPEGLTAAVRRGREETSLGPVAPGSSALRRLPAARRGPAVLRPAPGTMLEQTASLPLAAETELAAVLRNEMDRLTPFRAEDLFWDWRVERRDRAAGRLFLRLLMVPKTAVASLLAAAEAAGLRPEALEVATARGLEHLPLASPSSRGGSGRGTQLAAVLCAVLALAVCLLPIVRQELALRSVERVVARERPAVATVAALRRRLAANVSGADLFASESARVGNPLRALAAVTAALPDDTYLLSFSLRERAMTLSGRSAAATRLINTLSADPDLQEPAFDAPITRIGDKADLFSIRVRLAP